MVVAPTSWWNENFWFNIEFLTCKHCHLEFIDHAGLLVTIHLSSSLSNPTENVNQFLKLYSYTCMLQTWTGLVTTTSPLQKHNSSILLLHTIFWQKLLGLSTKVSSSGVIFCFKHLSKMDYEESEAVGHHKSSRSPPPWLFKSFHTLLVGSSSCVCPAMYAWAAWPGL